MKEFQASHWLESSKNVENLINLTLSLINPGQFQCGLQMLKKLRRLKNTKKVAVYWQSVFSGVSVIANRITPIHRDKHGRPEWFDMLANYCRSGSSPRFLVNPIGLDLDYSTGTVIGFCGNILEHQVRAWGEGDRVCFAHFMRDAVREKLQVPFSGWVELSTYKEHLS
jgi:hypothetical protein